MGGHDPEERARRRVCALFDACRAVAVGAASSLPGSKRGGSGTRAGRAVALRDAALVSILYGAGVERTTALALPVDAYDPESGRLQIGGAPDRRAVDGAREALADWLAARGAAPGPLLCRLTPHGQPDGRGLSPEDVDRLLSRWAERAGIEPWDPGSDPDALRRRYRSPWWKDAAGKA